MDAKDVTEQNQIEVTLEEQLRFLLKLQDTIPNPIFYKDSSGRYMGCNKVFEEFVGLTKEEIIGRTAHDIFPSDLADQYQQMDTELFSHPGVQAYESSVRYADGSRRDVVFNKATFTNADGTPVGLVGVFVDITEQKRLEKERLEARERMARIEKLTSLGIMAAGIAHEVNQPLNSLKVTADSLLYWYNRGKTLETKKVIEGLQRISSQAERIDSYIKRVRSIFQTGRSVPLSPCDLNQAVRKAVDHLKEQLTFYSIEVNKQLCSSLPRVLGDQVLLEEAVNNLLINAIQSLAIADVSPKKIVCRTWVEEQVVLEVSDNGPGVDESIKEKIFEPFFSTRTAGEGMGLGLSIVHSIINSLNGVIAVNRGECGGAAFTVKIPIAGQMKQSE